MWHPERRRYIVTLRFTLRKDYYGDASANFLKIDFGLFNEKEKT